MSGDVRPSDRRIARVAPGTHEVHLWKGPLDVSAQVAGRLAATASAGETARAARLRRPVDRLRFLTAHGWLRHVLAGYLGTEPAALAIDTDEHGKPRLDAVSTPWLRFNIAHSGSMVTIAIARDRDVGVDVEQIRAGVDIDRVANRFFTRAQRAELSARTSPERERAFFAMWTCHEAYLKATGTGLVGAATARAPRDWTVSAFDAAPGYAAAVAVRGHDVAIPRMAADLARGDQAEGSTKPEAGPSVTTDTTDPSGMR